MATAILATRAVSSFDTRKPFLLDGPSLHIFVVTLPRPSPVYSAPVVRLAEPASTDTGPARFTQPQTREIMRRMQIALLMKGYDPGPADGHLGSKTKVALQQFQTDSDLPATGFMDVDTLRRLGVIA